MICPKCKESISDEALICPSCDQEVARALQVQKCGEIRQKTKGLLNQEFHSKSYLVCTVFLAVACLIGIISLFNSIIGGNLVLAILPLAFTACALSSVIRMLKLYKAQGEVTGEQIKKLTAFISFMIVLGIFECIGFGVVAFLIGVVGMSAYSAAHRVGDVSENLSDMFRDVSNAGYEDAAMGESFFGSVSNLLETGSTIVLFLIIAVAALLVAYAVNFTMTYTNAKAYYRTLSETAEKCTYNTKKKAPVIRMYIFGGLTALLGLMMLVGAWQIALLFIGIGGYTIATGIWFNTVHQKQIVVYNEYCAEAKKLEEIETLTVQERCRIAKEQEKKKAAEEERQREKEAAERAEARLNQQQQQAMMQQMMMQMMANMQNGQSAPAEQTEPANETEE